VGLGSLAVGAEPSTTLFSGYTVLCTPRDGWIDGGRHGLFHRDCRVLSRHLLRVADSTPELVGAVQPESDRWVAVLRVPRPGGDAEGPQLPQDALEVQVERSVGPGLLEAIRVRNRSAVPCRTTLRLDLDADFADTAELNRKRKQHGTTDAETAAHAALPGVRERPNG
jgi:hypothetical protein